jgi:two-component system chemotaxis response regulator CheY
MNGIEFVREVRSDPKWDQMFLFMVTSDSSEGRMMEAMEAGADEYFLKPVHEQALKGKLELLGFEFE